MPGVQMCTCCKYVLHHATFFAGRPPRYGLKTPIRLFGRPDFHFGLFPSVFRKRAGGSSVRPKQLPLFRARFLFGNPPLGKRESWELGVQKKKRKTNGQLNTHTSSEESCPPIRQG